MSGALIKAFLDDIAADIDDDAPRLIFADWLAEHGHDDRAEFIRVQIERSRLPAWDAAQVRLRLREEALLKQHGEAWLAEMPHFKGAKWEGFRRGIVAEVSFASYEAMRESAHDCRLAAPVEAVTVRWPRRGEANADGAPIAELRELSLTGHPTAVEVAWLADSPQLSTLRVVTAHGLWADGLARLVGSPHLARLKALRLPTNDLGNAGVLALAGAAVLTDLEELDLTGRGVSERYVEDPALRSPGMETLAAWPGLASVRTLKLCGNVLGRAGLRALLRSPHIGSLKDLSLRDAGLDGQAMAELRDASRGLSLEALDLGENVLKEVGVEYVALAACLRDLKALRIDRCEIPLAGARVLARKAKFLDGLRKLDVGHGYFGPAGLQALLDRAPAALHTLGLRDNDLFDKGVGVLAGSPDTDGLLEIDLATNGLGAGAAEALAATDHLAGLLVLRLTDNAIPRAAADALKASPLGKRLAVLEVDDPAAASRSTGGEIPF